ncbi:MAG: dodecin domain-containing protein [Candidatus Brocadiae bacterium]|nr:dodecin domain-containing protein [Candidatus Brocadiia bacterium]
MAVARVTELVASSDKGFEDAIKAGVDRAAKTLRGITGVEVTKQAIKVEKNKVKEYRVHLSVTFILEN